ncbi:MAG: aminotransferase [Dehalococcoidales bacterium]|jgi:aspartate aminotransferase-like enzyme|nr:aminotransferase [Dehalococcoidales bacterium]MDP6448702.1 alanine--glyoxylate aminotransferase family protein [Dehalococcoidales bacterium]MDP6576610.1 alanine--glyoxylate aminotransferase family protein [Dehalococcoidales bacterium]MDP6825308.1 alanine--glyoxylate aminotransferase family protein [Dehalococcoidales bacterium]
MEQLRIPGPTPCPDEVLQAMARPMINHRGEEFGRILHEVTAKLKQLFLTKGDVFLLTASGTGGLEAAVVNTLSPGDKVLSVEVGVFGERFSTIARQFGAEVIPISVEWGRAADVADIRRALASEPKIKAVLVTHNETSTGMTNDLAAISSVVKEFDKLLLVDAISSLGSIELPTDKWGCDVTVTASQKGWMVPPGLAMVSVSEKAWQAYDRAKMPRFYWDFKEAKNYLEKGQTPWTPMVSTVFALAVSLDMMLQEGLTNIIARHVRVGQAARGGIKSLGLALFAEEKYASNTVTAVSTSDGLDAKKLVKVMKEEHGIVLAGGQQSLAGRIFRIGHLGWVTEDEITTVIAALKSALPGVGFSKTK